jgi:hypothetical protein
VLATEPIGAEFLIHRVFAGPAMTKIKIMIGPEPDNLTIVHPATPRGYNGSAPVVEITETEGVHPAVVLAAYQRTLIIPDKHAERSIPWALLEHAAPGEVIHLSPRAREPHWMRAGPEKD